MCRLSLVQITENEPLVEFHIQWQYLLPISFAIDLIATVGAVIRQEKNEKISFKFFMFLNIKNLKLYIILFEKPYILW